MLPSGHNHCHSLVAAAQEWACHQLQSSVRAVPGSRRDGVARRLRTCSPCFGMQVPGVEQILEAAGFQQSQSGLQLSLEANANARLLRNRLAELEVILPTAQRRKY